ncbi:hypothetical protein GPECTOR_2g1123 [Gonium pectorale]|uniref:DNA-directed RNA polymerase III subunit RPC3 n=1 Tax=Gonium pectorale TaxID=33097 RepID=A0A150H0L6_GONPE|nr:hypothetical protein GPECTOR_2g1123 [Gonium pectorale]|eukprot:KXZ55574.1 hypothetical protein GPECTOR_2g1123 [Gonium pectorale]
MASRKQYACDLAIRLVHDQYGDAVGKVFKQLAHKGQQPLTEIIRGTGLPAPTVKQALLILVQQNCINAYLQPGEETFRGPRPSLPVYEAHMDRVLQIIRHTRFLLHIKDEVGEVAEHIVAQLLQEGRLRMDQILGSVAARLGKPQVEVADTIRNTFISLVQGHYVERCPPCSLPPPIIRPHPNSVRSRKAKTAAGSEAHAAEQAGAVRCLEELAFEKQRFKVPQELALEMFAADGAAVAAGPGAGGGAAAAADGAAEVGGEKAEGAAAAESGAAAAAGGGGRGAKRRAEAEAEADGGEELAVKAAPAAKKARKRAGTAKVDVVTPGAAAAGGRPGAAGGGAPGGPSSPVAEPSVLLWRVNNDEFNRRFRHQAMVSLVREKFDDDAAAVAAAMMSAARPYETTVKDERSVQLSEEEVESAVTKLVDAGGAGGTAGVGARAASAVEAGGGDKEEDGDEHSGAGRGRGLKQVEAVVKSRYDVAGLRVADLAMLPPKDTRELLYRMLAGGFVLLQLYRAATRVYTRLRHEMDKERELLSLLEAAKETRTVTFTITAAQRAAFARLKQVTEVMECGLQHLDEMIALFNDY